MPPPSLLHAHPSTGNDRPAVLEQRASELGAEGGGAELRGAKAHA